MGVAGLITYLVYILGQSFEGVTNLWTTNHWIGLYWTGMES